MKHLVQGEGGDRGQVAGSRRRVAGLPRIVKLIQGSRVQLAECQ